MAPNLIKFLNWLVFEICSICNFLKFLKPNFFSSTKPDIIKILDWPCLDQGLLKIWTGQSHWFLLNPKPFEIASQKFQHCYNLERNEFSPNLKSVAQNLDLLCPFDVSDDFEPHPSNLARIHFTPKCKNAEIFEWLSQTA